MNDMTARRQALRSAAFDEALAGHLGLNVTDLRCLELVVDEPGLTPSRMAELSGLTTGAVTGVLDRLEKAGFIARRPDPADRRSVTVRPVAGRVGELTAALEPLDRAIAVAAGDRSAGELAAIDAFLAAAGAAVNAEMARLRAGSRGGFVGPTYSAPLGETTRGRLVFASGAPRLAVNIAPLGPRATARLIMETSASRLAFEGPTSGGELIRAAFDGPRPDVRTSGGTVTIRYRRQAIAAFSSRHARIALSGAIPWSIELDGGITDLTGTFDGLTLERLDVEGGANHVTLDLPAPAGSVLVRLRGVASSARFRRPAGIPMAVRVAGGVSHLRLDGQKHEQVSGDRRFVSGGFAEKPDRYELEILGGASDVRVSER